MSEKQIILEINKLKKITLKNLIKTGINGQFYQYTILNTPLAVKYVVNDTAANKESLIYEKI